MEKEKVLLPNGLFAFTSINDSKSQRQNSSHRLSKHTANSSGFSRGGQTGGSGASQSDERPSQTSKMSKYSLSQSSISLLNVPLYEQISHNLKALFNTNLKFLKEEEQAEIDKNELILSQIDQKIKEIQDIQETMQKIDTLKANEKSNIDEFTTNLSKTKEKISSLKIFETNLELKIKNLARNEEMKLAEIEEKNEGLGGVFKKLKKRKNELKERIEEVGEETEELRSKIETIDKIESASNAEILSKLEDFQSQKDLKFSQKNSEIIQQNIDFLEQKKELKILEDQKRALLEELRASESFCSELSLAKATFLTNIQKMVKEKKSLSMAIDNFNSTAQKRTSSLSNEFALLRKKNADLRHKIEELNKEREEALAKNQGKTSKNALDFDRFGNDDEFDQAIAVKAKPRLFGDCE